MSLKYYPTEMLSQVNYRNLEGDFGNKLIYLEFETMKNISDFIEDLKKSLINQKLVMNAEMLLAHLASYLGFLIVATSKKEESSHIQSEIIHFLKMHVKQRAIMTRFRG